MGDRLKLKSGMFSGKVKDLKDLEAKLNQKEKVILKKWDKNYRRQLKDLGYDLDVKGAVINAPKEPDKKIIPQEKEEILLMWDADSKIKITWHIHNKEILLRNMDTQGCGRSLLACIKKEHLKRVIPVLKYVLRTNTENLKEYCNGEDIKGKRGNTVASLG